MSASSPAQGPGFEHRRHGRTGKTLAGLRRWATSDPKNLVTSLTLPLVVCGSVAEIRWHRAAGESIFSPRGVLAYARARPKRVACSVVVSLLPDLVALVVRRRRQSP